MSHARHREATFGVSDYRPIIGGDGHTAGHVRRRFANAREFWQYRPQGEPEWIDAETEDDAEVRCFDPAQRGARP